MQTLSQLQNDGMNAPKQAEQPAFILWFVGRPASGKSTLARAVQARLRARAIPVCLLDSDEVRAILTPTPTYSPAERDWFYQALAGLALLLARSGVNVAIAATAPLRAYRTAVRSQWGHFVEVYVECALATCQARDPKGIYALAQAGLADNVPGVGALFEAPLTPEITVNAELQSPTEAANVVLGDLNKLYGV
ncbi:MAG: adenylyl-sulfate kinase [Caldilineaceae bacterium]